MEALRLSGRGIARALILLVGSATTAGSQPIGACCELAGCEIIGMGDCDAEGGVYLGDGTSCGACPVQAEMALPTATSDADGCGTVAVRLSTPNDVEGYVTAVCHDGLALTLESVQLGADADAVGAEFVAATPSSDGGTLGVVFDLFSPFDGQTLTGLDQIVATYRYCCNERPEVGQPAIVTPLEFCDGFLGDPELDNLIVVDGLSFNYSDGLVLTDGSFACTAPVAPANDECLAPDPIAGCEITVSFDNTGATTDGVSHDACLSFGSGQVYSDLWYCWDPPYDADVAVQTCGGTSLDTRLNVYGPFADCEEAASVCPAGDGDLLECNDDACGLQSRAEFSAEDGNVYLVRLGSWNPGAQGSGAFEVTCQEQVEMCTAGTPGGVCQLPKTEVDGPTGPNGSSATTDELVSADDFTPSVSADITHLAWWGVYVNGQMGGPVECGPGAGDTFTVTYYLDDGGLPGAILAGPMPVENLAKCATGEDVRIGPTPGIDEYRYEADHVPVPVQAGETYWVEISNVVPDVDCDWLWRTSEDGNGTHASDFGSGYGPQDLDQAFCYNTIRKTCRSAGYYMTHSSTEDGSRDVTGELLAAAGCLEICGEVIRTTAVDDADSAVEALCESPRGTQERQLARQLTALGLNCIASGYGPLCRGWADVEELFAECNAVCEFGENGWTVDECIAAIACVNDGGDPFATPGACFTGTCSDNGAPCSVRDKQHCESPTLATCEPLPETCHDRDICNAGLGICVSPGTAANPTSCKKAKMSACSVLEVGRTTEADCEEGVQLDEESCCNDPAECDDGEFCTEDQCIVGPGCDNQPIPLCCEDNGDCMNPLPTCDLATNTCMECTKNEDCDDSDVCTMEMCDLGACLYSPIADCCHDDGECVDPQPLCHPTDNVCVECVDDGDCPPAEPFCNQTNPDPSSRTCRECRSNAHCDDGVACTLDRCVGPGACIHPPGPIAPPNPCEENCVCDPVLGRTCDAVPNCCFADEDCSTPDDVCIDFECGPPGEREACGDDNNGGCNSEPPVYDSVECGATVSGNVWADGGTRDTDWYLLSVPDPDGDGFTRIQATPTASDQVLVFILDGIATCSPEIKGDVGCAGPWIPVALADAVLPAPGEYVVFVAPGMCDGGGIFDGIPCPGATYSVDVTCSDVSTTTTSTSSTTSTTLAGPPSADVTFAITVTSDEPSNDTPTQLAVVRRAFDPDDEALFTITLGGDPLAGGNTASVTVGIVPVTDTTDGVDYTPTISDAIMNAAAVTIGVSFAPGTGVLTFDEFAAGTLSFGITALVSSDGSETLNVGLSAPTVDAGSATITPGQDVATVNITNST